MTALCLAASRSVRRASILLPSPCDRARVHIDARMPPTILAGPLTLKYLARISAPDHRAGAVARAVLPHERALSGRSRRPCGLLLDDRCPSRWCASQELATSRSRVRPDRSDGGILIPVCAAYPDILRRLEGPRSPARHIEATTVTRLYSAPRRRSWRRRSRGVAHRRSCGPDTGASRSQSCTPSAHARLNSSS